MKSTNKILAEEPAKKRSQLRVSKSPLEPDQLMAIRLSRLLYRLSIGSDGLEVEGNRISLSEWRILASLGRSGFLTVGEISNYSGTDHSIASRSLKMLTAKGLIETRKSKKDRRQTLAQLTEEGLRIHDAIAPHRIRAMKERQMGLTQKELSTFNKLCTKLENHIDLIEENDGNGWD